MEERKQTISEIIEEVKTDICDNYCKYPNEIRDEDELYDICKKCPLVRLG